MSGNKVVIKALQAALAAVQEPDGVAHEIAIYEPIGEDWFGNGVTAHSIKRDLEAAQPHSKIRVRINSPGGDVFEGIAIHNLLRSQGKPIETCVDGIAASSASIIAMAGDEITMGNNAMMMIHNAWSMCMGDANDMRKTADTLDKVSASIAQTYMDRTGKTAEEIKGLMDAETWMSAADCVENGFATAILGKDDPKAMALARQFPMLAKYAKRPAELQNKAGDAKTKRVDGEDLTWSDFIVALDHEDIGTWHLPYKFSTAEKTKAHLRDALARFDQVQGLTTEQKHAAYTKLIRLCKQYGIQVSAEDRARYQVWAKADLPVRADSEDGDGDNGEDDEHGDEEQCGCDCENCMNDDCENCTNKDCMDEYCEDCPMQKDDAVDSSNNSNLSQYEARLKLLRVA